MERSPGRGRLLACLALGILCVGCSRPAGAPPATPTGATSAEQASASATPAPTSAPPSVPPSAEPGASGLGPSAPAEPSMGEPPAASLAVEGGDPVVGELGSFTWRNAGSDSPWLPGNPIHVGTGERLTVTLAEPVAVDTWTVSRSPADQLGDPVTGMGAGSTAPIEFGPPPAGTWSVSVSVWFADNLGSATYYWRVEVD